MGLCSADSNVYLHWCINISHRHVDENDSRYVARLTGALNELDQR